MIDLFLSPLIVALAVLGLIFCARLKGYGNYIALKDFSPEFHDFIRYTVDGLIIVGVFTYWNDISLQGWEWLVVFACGALMSYAGESFGTGWQSGAISHWDANLYWETMEQETWMGWPIIKQIVDILPRNMFGVFCVMAIRGSLWGVWALPLYFIDPLYLYIAWSWCVSLPTASAIGKAMEVSVGSHLGSWERKEETRSLLALINALVLTR